MIYIVLLLGLLVRLISLNQSLWLDEATTALVSKMPIVDFFTKFMPADFHPPLYYLVISYWSLVVGHTEIALRIPSVIFGVLTVYVVYLVAKEIKFKKPLYPALMLATSGLHIYYSQEARMYGMVTWLVSCLVLSYLRRKWVMFSILLCLIFLTDYLSILIVPALLVYVLIYDRQSVKRFLYSLAPLFVTFVVWLPTFANQIGQGLAVKSSQSEWWNILGPVTFKNIALIPAKFIIGRVSLDDKSLYAVLIAVLVAIFGYSIMKAKNKLLWSWFGVSILLGIAVSFYVPTLTYFRYLFVLPAFYLLISENISKKLFYSVLIINIVTSGAYLFLPKFHRENWRSAANIIGSERIVFPVNSQKEGLTYYGKASQIISKEQLTKEDNKIWLSRYVWDIFDPTDLTRKYIEDLGYNKVTEVNLNGVILYKYENRN